MALTAGINFRATFDYVFDLGGEVWGLGEAYPTTRGGYTFGWDTDITSSSRNRSTSVDRRLAGIVFSNNTSRYFRVDLPSAGTYEVRIAAGDVNSGNGALWDIQDTSTVLASLTGDVFGTNNWKDATDVLRTSSSNWVSNNAAASYAFATTQFRLKVRAAASSNNVIAHVRIDSVETPPTGPASRRLFQHIFRPEDPLFLFDE